MALPTGTILGILSDNLAKRGSVLPLSKTDITRWADGLDLPRGGETVLYTGHMYQLIPAISAMAGQMAALENSWITRFFPLGRLANKFVNLSFFMGLTASSEQKADCDRMLRNIASLLQGTGVRFGYLYEEEMYAGTLAYDEGMDDVFRKHAEKVWARFKKQGVKHVITVDPHTTHLLREIYPNYVEGFDLRVQSYLEVLADTDSDAEPNRHDEVVIHDSCVYARYEDMVDQPRQLLERRGISVKEPDQSGKATFCCGGPIESLFPGEAHRISQERVKQLQAAGGCIATMCPICWVNLSKAADAGTEVKDISDILVQA